MIAIAPVVADARFAVDNQRIDLQLLKTCRDRKSGLSAADHQRDRIVVGIFGRGLAQIEPIGAAKIPRIGLAPGPRSSLLLLKTFQFVERREQRPGFEPVAIAVVGDQAQNSAAAALRGLKFENRFDRVGAGAGHPARRGAVGVDLKTAGSGAVGVSLQLGEDCIGAVDGLQAPAQRQHIAPIAVGVKQGFQQAVIGFCERSFELRQPIFRGDRDIVGSVQHWCFS